MTTIVKGHGADEGFPDTFVPDGATVRMYSAESVNLRTNVALLALLDEAGEPGLPIHGPIKNYTLFAQDDRFIAQWYAIAGESGVPIKWVGTDIPDGTRLCESPEDEVGPDVTACRSLGYHGCAGVLGLVQDTDIALVACRGVPGGPIGAVPTAYDTTSDGINALVDEYVTRLESGDPAEVAQVEDDFDHVPQDVLALMINRKYFADWTKARWVKEYAEQNDLEQLFGQLESNVDRLTGIMVWLNRIPAYGDAVDTAATSYQDVFFRWLEAASTPVQTALMGRSAIGG
ncbi:MAG: hypothetical protein ACRD0A_17510 [Acidimicrobiales bacterium]